MSFAFSLRDATVTHGLRRIAREQIAAALQEARDEAFRPAERIHSVRQRCKNLRGLLRLVRPAFSGFADENAAIRSAAAGLSAIRDAEVLQRTFATSAGRARSKAAVPKAPMAMIPDRRREETEALSRFAAALEPLLRRAEKWTLDRNGFAALAEGLTLTCTLARKAMGRAERGGASADFHEWRQQTKYHWHHLVLLCDCAPTMLREHLKAARRLSDMLGDCHDIDVMLVALSDHPAIFGDDADLGAVRGEAGRRRAALARRALRLGRELFAESPSALTRRLRRYWRNWRHGAGSP